MPLCLLLAAQQQGGSIAKLLKTLPERYTYSDRIKEFPTELSQSILAEIQTGQLTQDATVLHNYLADRLNQQQTLILPMVCALLWLMMKWCICVAREMRLNYAVIRKRVVMNGQKR